MVLVTGHVFDKLPVVTILLSEVLKPDVFKTKAETPVTQVSRTRGKETLQ